MHVEVIQMHHNQTLDFVTQTLMKKTITQLLYSDVNYYCLKQKSKESTGTHNLWHKYTQYSTLQ